MNELIYAILVAAWITPGLASFLNKRQRSSRTYVEAGGCVITLILLIILLLWFWKRQSGILVESYGFSIMAVYPAMLGYAVLAFRSIRRAICGEEDYSSTWSILVLFLLAGLLGVILAPYLSVMILSWGVILYMIYQLITYKDLDLEARHYYREKVEDEYLDRF